MRRQIGKVASAIVVPATGLLRRFVRAESGATAIEYGLIAALMAVVCITAFRALGGSSSGAWGNTANLVSAAMAK